MSKPRPTDAEFEELKRQRDAALAASVAAACAELGWDPAEATVHVRGASGCYCACPDGPCQHVWDGPDYVDDTCVSGTCSRCGAVAMFHDMARLP